MRLRLAVPLLCTLALGADARGEHYAESKGWQFDNFKDPVYSWDIYRDTFLGIPPTEDALASAFDVLFYDQLYKDKLSDNGNCFGLSLQSLLMLEKGGHLGYCLPIDQYSGDIFGAGPGNSKLGPTDPMLRRAINVMHGHQVNLPTLQHIMNVIAIHKNRDGSYAYGAFLDARMQDDPAVISITKTLNPDDGGHSMVPYDAQDLGGGNRRIYVYDPNRSWADPAFRPWYTGNQNYVQISGNAWSFTMESGATWSGDPGSGGNILILPISVTGPHSRSPASLGDQIIGQILTSLLITGSDAEIEQVTDDAGKRLYRPGTREIDVDPSTGMLNVVPWYPSDDSEPRRPRGTALFRLGRAAPTLHVSVRHGGGGYALLAGGPRCQATVRASGGGADLLSFHQAGSEAQRVELRPLRGRAEYRVELSRSDPAARRILVLGVSRMTLSERGSVTVSATDSHTALALASEAPLRYDLELRQATSRGVERLTRAGIDQDAGTRRTVRPADWYHLPAADVLETIAPVEPVRRGATEPAPPTKRSR